MTVKIHVRDALLAALMLTDTIEAVEDDEIAFRSNERCLAGPTLPIILDVRDAA